MEVGKSGGENEGRLVKVWRPSGSGSCHDPRQGSVIEGGMVEEPD